MADDANGGHSRLLKFVLPPSPLNKMADKYIVKFEYTSPPNVESSVPGVQKLRQTSETTQDDDNKSTSNENLPPTNEKDSTTYTPVYTVTKNEVGFTKGDLKLQKVSVSEDIAESKANSIQIPYTVVNPFYSDVRGEVVPGPQILRVADGVKEIEEKASKEDKKPQTRIPRFKQTVEKVRKERKDSRDKNDESLPPQKDTRRTSIPRLKQTTLPTPKDIPDKEEIHTGKKSNETTISPEKHKTDRKDEDETVRRNSMKNESNDTVPVKTKYNYKSITEAQNINRNTNHTNLNKPNEDKSKDNGTIVPEDEFDKIYEEIVDNTPTESVIESIIIDKIDDPEKLEMSFEEIIHDYEENNIELIDDSKRKLSKQISLHDDKKPKLRERRYSLEENENDEKSQDRKVSEQDKSASKPFVSQTITHIPVRSKVKEDIKENNIPLQNKGQNYTAKNLNETDKQINDNAKTIIGDLGNDSQPLNEINIPKEFVQVAIPVNLKFGTNPRESPNKSSENQTEKLKNSDVKVDIEHKIDETNLLNENQSTVPDSTKLVQNMLSKKDPQSIDECAKIAKDDAMYKVNKTDDDPLAKVRSQPRRRSLKSRIAVLIRKRSMDAKDKLDKGDLYPKDTNKNDEGSEHVNDQDIKLNEDNNHNRLIDNSPKPPENISNAPEERKTKKPLSTDNALALHNNNKSSTENSLGNTQNQNNHKQHKLSPNETSDSSENISEKKSIQNSNAKENGNKDVCNQKSNNEEDDDENSVPILKGRVNKIISRLDSHQGNTKPTVDIENEIPVKKSVSSRIAMFERQASKEPETPPVILRKKTENKFKPKIISEVLKPVIQNAPKPNEIRVENIKRESIIIDEDMDNNYIEINYVNDKELYCAEYIAVSEEKHSDNENTISYNRDDTTNVNVQNNSNEVNENVKRLQEGKINAKTSFNKDTKTANQIDDTDVQETGKTLNLGILKQNNNINKTDSEKQYLEHSKQISSDVADQLDEPITSKQKLTPSKSETHLPLYRREKSIVEEKLKILNSRTEEAKKERSKSVAELDLGDAIKGKVHQIILRINSREDLLEVEKKPAISAKERPKTRTVSERIALFEKKITPILLDDPETTTTKRPIVLPTTSRMKSIFTEKPDRAAEGRPEDRTVNNNGITTTTTPKPNNVEATTNPSSYSEEEYLKRIEDLVNTKTKYGRVGKMVYLKLNNGLEMPILSLGTAMMNERLLRHIIGAAIDMGYRGIDAAYIYGNEKAVGDAIKEKIADGTVTRRDLFITNKLWSTHHRQDLVEEACRASLQAMGLEYFDLYIIHNPMSFKEGGDPIPKIANVLQYSDSDYLDAWYGMEGLVSKGLVKSIGVSNFNAAQVTRVAEKARVKPIINQVECHPYLTQLNLEHTCKDLGIKLSCFGILGSKGTPAYLKSHETPVIEDPMVKVMAAGLNVTTAQLLVRYQIQHGRAVVTKASSADHLWDILGSLNFTLSSAEMDALDALNRNKRTYTFKGMGDTHKNYPFKAAY